jgi:hypothetical protein
MTTNFPSVVYKSIEMRPISKVNMDVYKDGEFFERMMITPFSLTCLDIPAREQGRIIFDLNQISGRGNTPSVKAAPASPVTKREREINPKWLAYNNLLNEGEEGYNPHCKYLYSPRPHAPLPSPTQSIAGQNHDH